MSTPGIPRRARVLLRCAVALGLLILLGPLALVVVNSFNADPAFGWPPPSFTGAWWVRAAHSAGIRAALWTSVKAGLGATAAALLLGTAAAFAVHRHRFFGRRAFSFALVLPLALPGIVTGIALNAAFRTVLHLDFGLLTVIAGHAAFCVVVVHNNALARLRRTGSTLQEASADLGAGPFATLRRVTFPLLRSALAAGALLAFALSFDEIVVTTFTAGPGTQTLPIWIYTNLARPNQAPVVNVVAAVLVAVSLLPVWLAQRLSSDAGGGRV